MTGEQWAQLSLCGIYPAGALIVVLLAYIDMRRGRWTRTDDFGAIALVAAAFWPLLLVACAGWLIYPLLLWSDRRRARAHRTTPGDDHA